MLTLSGSAEEDATSLEELLSEFPLPTDTATFDFGDVPGLPDLPQVDGNLFNANSWDFLHDGLLNSTSTVLAPTDQALYDSQAETAVAVEQPNTSSGPLIDLLHTGSGDSHNQQQLFTPFFSYFNDATVPSSLNYLLQEADPNVNSVSLTELSEDGFAPISLAPPPPPSPMAESTNNVQIRTNKRLAFQMESETHHEIGLTILETAVQEYANLLEERSGPKKKAKPV